MIRSGFAIAIVTAVLAACGTPDGEQATAADAPAPQPAVVPASVGEKPLVSPQRVLTLDDYKRDLALRISQTNAVRVHDGRPQALLRSVIVVKYVIDSRGNLVRSDILRSNRDRQTEAIALASLKSAAPFPRPMSHLLRNGRIELAETWLFNDDGRFQLRTIAQPQMDQ